MKAEILDMLDRGEIDLAQNLLHELQPDPARFALAPLSSVDLLAAWEPALLLGPDVTIEVESLAGRSLLLLDVGFANGWRFRRTSE